MTQHLGPVCLNRISMSGNPERNRESTALSQLRKRALGFVRRDLDVVGAEAGEGRKGSHGSAAAKASTASSAGYGGQTRIAAGKETAGQKEKEQGREEASEGPGGNQGGDASATRSPASRRRNSFE